MSSAPVRRDAGQLQGHKAAALTSSSPSSAGSCAAAGLAGLAAAAGFCFCSAGCLGAAAAMVCCCLGGCVACCGAGFAAAAGCWLGGGAAAAGAGAAAACSLPNTMGACLLLPPAAYTTQQRGSVCISCPLQRCTARHLAGRVQLRLLHAAAWPPILGATGCAAGAAAIVVDVAAAAVGLPPGRGPNF